MGTGFFKKIKGVFGILLVLASVGLMIFWETTGREEFLFDSAVVLARDISPGEVVTQDMFKLAFLEGTNIVDGNLEDIDSVIGKVAKYYLPENTQVVANFFEENTLVRKEDEYNFMITNNWIFSMPFTVRRGDTVLFIPIDTNLFSRLESEHARVNDTEFTWEMFLQLHPLEPLMEKTVIYAKDSGGREVFTVDGSSEKRLSSSSTVNNLQIYATLEEISLIEKYVNNNYTLLVIYS